jgi:hypothetical protein
LRGRSGGFFIAFACLAAALGVVIGVGLGTYAVVGLATAGGLVLLGSVVAPRYYALAVLVLLCLAPWQQLAVVQSTIWLFPVLWVVFILVVFAMVKGALGSVPVLHVVVGLSVVAWTLLGLGLGYGRLGLVLKWSGLWIAGVGLFSLATVVGARAVLVKWLPALGALMSAYTILEFVLKYNPLYGGVVSRWVEPSFLAAASFRPTGTLGHPLTVADFLGFAIVVTLVGLRSRVISSRRAVLFLVVESTGLVLTGARGILLLTVLAAIVLTVASSEALGGRLRLAALIASTAGVVWLAFGDLVLVRFAGIAQSQSLEQRFAGFAAAAAVVKESPLFGKGAGYGALALQQLGYPIINYESEWAGLLIGLGVPGALLALSTPLLSIKAAVSARWRGPAGEMAVASAIYAFGMAGTHNLFEWWGGAMVFWVCVAFSSPSEELKATGAIAEGAVS